MPYVGNYQSISSQKEKNLSFDNSVFCWEVQIVEDCAKWDAVHTQGQMYAPEPVGLVVWDANVFLLVLLVTDKYVVNATQIWLLMATGPSALN